MNLKIILMKIDFIRTIYIYNFFFYIKKWVFFNGHNKNTLKQNMTKMHHLNATTRHNYYNKQISHACCLIQLTCCMPHMSVIEKFVSHAHAARHFFFTFKFVLYGYMFILTYHIQTTNSAMK